MSGTLTSLFNMPYLANESSPGMLGMSVFGPTAYSGIDSIDPSLSFLNDLPMSTKNRGGGDVDQLTKELMGLGIDFGNKAQDNNNQISKMSSDLARYGVTSLSNLVPYEIPDFFGKGDSVNLFRNTLNNQLVPQQFGSSMAGDGGTWYSLQNVDGKVIPVANWGDTSDKAELTAALSMFAAVAGAPYAFGDLATTGGGIGVGGGAGGAATAEGATGLSSLPAAGTWAQTTTPTLGMTAGEWSVPESLVGYLGDTGASGTLGMGLSNANAVGDSLGTFGTSLGGPSTVSQNNIFDTLKNLYNTSSNNTIPKIGGNTTQQTGGTSMDSSNSNLLSLLGNLYNMYNNPSKDVTSLADQMLKIGDPFGDQRQKYEQLLADSYNNPAGTYDQYKSQDQTFFNQLSAQNAARGRSTDAYKMGVERESAFNNWLTNYRTQLGGFAGAQFDPSQMAGNYFNAQNNANILQNAYTNYALGSVGNMFSNPGSVSSGISNTLGNLSDLFNAGKTAWNWGSSALGNIFG